MSVSPEATPELALAAAIHGSLDAALNVANQLLEKDESYHQAAVRLEQTYGLINVPVGIPARALVALLFSVHQAVTLRTQLQVDPMAELARMALATRQVTYGPSRRQMTPTSPPGGTS